MAEQTTNYNLTKQAPNEFYDRVLDNENLDKIDRAIKGVENLVPSSQDIANFNQRITDTENGLTTHLAEFTQHTQGVASLTNVGHTQLSNAIDSSSDILAATPFAVKQAYDRGSDAFNGLNEVRAEFLAFKAALTEGFTSNQFSDGLTSLNAFIVTAGYYNLPLTRLEV